MIYLLFYFIVGKSDAYKYSAFFIVAIICFTFIANIVYLMARERINMRYLYKNYPLHHFMNKFLLRGINVLIRLISMSSILELIFTHFLRKQHYIQLSFTFVTMPIIMFIFVFIMSDIIFNEFIYERNQFILDTHKYLQTPGNTKTMFPNSIKLIWNTTRDKFSRMSPTTNMTNKNKINKIAQCTQQLQLIINSYFTKNPNITGNNQLSMFNKFCKLVNKYQHYEIIPKVKLKNIAIIWDKINWFKIRYDINNNNNENINTIELIFYLNFYRDKISDIFLL